MIGGARDGFFGGHVIGPVSGALLHRSPIPVALAPRGYAEDPPTAVAAVTAAVPTRPGPDNPLPFAITLASAARLAIRTVTLLSAENLSEAADVDELRQIQLAASEDICAVAARALPDAPEIECLVADGLTLESALKKLNWEQSDLLVVGSSRFAPPRRVFLGSTAARILAGTRRPGRGDPPHRISVPRIRVGDYPQRRANEWEICCWRPSSKGPAMSTAMHTSPLVRSLHAVRGLPDHRRRAARRGGAADARRRHRDHLGRVRRARAASRPAWPPSASPAATPSP